ncbi:MAG: hypothetical protein RML72_02810, partial [Bacteroidia bacterium]|nr:hypothetical protein [Bacteroidia bacterium]MDW8157791.1 hypothetical protein [Bacteroidia bacterium]
MHRLILIISSLVSLILGCSHSSKQPEKKNIALVAHKVEEPQYNRYWNDLARFLAGLPPLEGSVLDSI